MAKRIYEEYFGAESVDTENKAANTILNRWQYRVLQILTSSNPSEITPDSLEGKLLSENYKPIADEDQGAANMNASKPSQEDIEKFIGNMKQKGFVDENNGPNFDERFNIRQPIKFPKLSGPRGGFLELTKACNLDCITCYNEFTRAQSRKMLPPDKQREVLDQFASFGASWIALTGGETTLAPVWFELAKHAKDKGMAVRVYTCGIYPEREETLKQLIELNPAEIRLTYAGMHATNDMARPRKKSKKGTFDEITHTVEELVKDGQPVKLNYILAHENLVEVESFIRFVYRLSQKYSKPIPINIGPLRIYGKASMPNRFTAPTAEDFMYVNNLIRGYRNMCSMEISVVFDCAEKLDEVILQEKRAKMSNTPWPYLHQGCSFGRNAINIAYDGTVNICGIMGDKLTDNVISIINEEPEFYQQFEITPESLKSNEFTSVRQLSIEDIWYKSPLLSFFQFFYRKEQCEPCDKYRVQCMGICPGMALADSGDLRIGDKGCFKHLLGESKCRTVLE